MKTLKRFNKKNGCKINMNWPTIIEWEGIYHKNLGFHD